MSLGYRRPQWWHIVLALVAAGAFFALSTGFDILGGYLTPATARDVNSANSRIFGQLTADPAGVATIALAAGVCEEALFRGALQPRLGILWTSLVFASVHSQYGLSFDALAVFVLAIGLGLLRRCLSTTASTICHVAYDFLAGFGLGVQCCGYPDALSGESIKDVVRILTIADIFAALIEHRPYRPTMPRTEAYNILCGMTGKLEKALVTSFKDIALTR